MNFYIRNFKLGHIYTDTGLRKLKFIKVTPKGFNLLDLETNRCIMNKHLYSRNWYNKDMPTNIYEVNNVWVPDHFVFKEVKEVTHG